VSTGIQRTDETWNPVRGCSRVSLGCQSCYAEREAHRHSGPGRPYEGLTRSTSRGPVWTGEIRLVPEMLDRPLRWRKARRVFVNSMADLFHDGVPDEYIDRVFGVAAITENVWRCTKRECDHDSIECSDGAVPPVGHTYQILTKRPERMRAYCSAPGRRDLIRKAAHRVGWYFSDDALDFEWPLRNVWLGVSVENQATADERIPLLLQTPAAVRFVSYEPALGPLAFKREWWPTDAPARLDWMIVGGESGPGARPFDVAWARETIRQCEGAGVAVFVKQLGAKPRGLPFGGFLGGFYDEVHFDGTLDDRKGADPTEWPADLRRQDFPA
jgi:protein gp37